MSDGSMGVGMASLMLCRAMVNCSCPNFGTPASNLFTLTGARRSNAGEIRNTILSSREMQLALKLVF